MIPKRGTSVQSCRQGSRQQCASDLARALKEEFADSSHAAKTLMRWTGVSNRGARYWLSGERCPNGWQLILLASHSDAVLRAMLQMCGRPALELGFELDAVKQTLGQAMVAIAAIECRLDAVQRASGRGASAMRQANGKARTIARH
jgi:hypothetical protein